jgi:hypothetical protein
VHGPRRSERGQLRIWALGPGHTAPFPPPSAGLCRTQPATPPRHADGRGISPACR